MKTGEQCVGVYDTTQVVVGDQRPIAIPPGLRDALARVALTQTR